MTDFRGLVSALEGAGHRVDAHETLASTNTRAMALAADGAPHGQLVVADHQSAGRGRAGRAWYSPPGEHLYLSVVWRFDWPASEAPTVTLQAAIAAAEAIEQVAGVTVGLKWPNDLLFDGRKCGGILTELRSRGTRVDAIVIGIGIDVGSLHGAPAEVADIAISLSDAAGRSVDRAALAVALAERLEAQHVDFLRRPGWNRAGWRAWEATLGRSVRIRVTGEPEWAGVAVDVDAGGQLRVRDSHGVVRTITTGDVVFD